MNSYDIPWRLIIAIVIVAIIVKVVVEMMYNTPAYPRVDEGFYGGAIRGTGHPDCLRDSPNASQLLNIVSSDTNSENYRELELLLSKMACLKKDIMSPSGVINATRYQAFDTNHDRVSVAELAGMCMSKNIPLRDLDIIFQTWSDRGKQLIALCTQSATNVNAAETLFSDIWKDIYDVAQSVCIKHDLPQQSPGDVGAYEPEHLANRRIYGELFA
jgi:hypothetical protein